MKKKSRTHRSIDGSDLSHAEGQNRNRESEGVGDGSAMYVLAPHTIFTEQVKPQNAYKKKKRGYEVGFLFSHILCVPCLYIHVLTN